MKYFQPMFLKNHKINYLLIVIIFGFFNSAYSQTNTYSGASSGNWSVPANWSLNVVPTAAHDVVIPNNFTVNVNTAAVCNSFTVNGGNSGNTIIIGANSLTVTGAVTIGAPSALNGLKTITISTGTLSCGSISFANPSLSSQMCEITITGAGTLTVSGNIAMAGDYLENSLYLDNGGTLNIGGYLSGGHFSSTNSNSTINFNGTAAQLIPMNSSYYYDIVKINNTAGATFETAITTADITGNIIVESGILNNGGFAIAGNLGKTFTVANGATFKVSGTSSSFPSGFGTYALGAASTVEYSGSGNQTVFDVTSPGYGNLTLSGGNIKTVASNGLDVQGNVTVNSGPTLALGNYTHAITGNFTNSSTVTALTSGTINLTGNLLNSGSFTGLTTGSMTVTGSFTNSSTFSGPTSGSLSVGSGLTNSGTFTAPTSGTFTVTGSMTNSGTFTGATTGTMNITGNFSNTGGTFTAGTTSTMNLTGNFTNSATFTAGTGASNLCVGGNWNNTGGTFNAGSNGKVTFNSTTTGKTISGNLSSGSKFYNLTFNGNGGSWAISNNLTVANTLAVTNGAVSMISGVLTLEANAAFPALGGTLTLENSASLIQSGYTGANTGSINVNRNSTNIVLDDYTYWSSPTSGTQTLGGFSPNTQTDKFFKFDNSAWVYAPTTTVFASGIGYAVLSPEGVSPSAPSFVAHQFTGVPNNGTITIDGTYNTSRSFKLIGNPYPSAIDATAFINANLTGSGTINQTIEGTLYFWTHNHGLIDGAYSASDYATYNLTGGTAVTSGTGNTSVPTQYIASGQGFFIETTAAGNVSFTNSMRTSGATDNSNFYKSSNAKTASGELEAHRIWLNLTNNTSTNFSQALVGYIESATNGYDPGYDGLCFGTNQFVLYSLIGNGQYAIQGRALPFTDTDMVQFGYKINVAGEAIISIDHIDGLFLAGQNIYIEDKLLNVIHNLKLSPYTFASEAGTFNNRFLLRYVDSALSLETFEESSNNVTVSSKNSNITIKSKTEPIKQVIIYDILGRQIYENKKVSGNEVLITDLTHKQSLIIKTILSNGLVVTKKLVY